LVDRFLITVGIAIAAFLFIWLGKRINTRDEEEASMQGNKEARVDDYTDLCCHPAVRPLIWVKDVQGFSWLCDNDVNPSQDFRSQECWRCDEIAFPAGGR